MWHKKDEEKQMWWCQQDSSDGNETSLIAFLSKIADIILIIQLEQFTMSKLDWIGKKDAIKEENEVTKLEGGRDYSCWVNIKNKAFNSKIGKLDEDVFENSTVKHVAQFTMMLENIADYIQITYSKYVADARRNISIVRPEPTIMFNPDGNPVLSPQTRWMFTSGDWHIKLFASERRTLSRRRKRCFPLSW